MLIYVEMYRHIFLFILAIILIPAPVLAQDEDGGERAIELYNQAQSAHEQGDLVKAIGLYREVIKLLPDRFEPKYQCAAACLASGKPEFEKEAVTLLKQVVELKPDFARGHAELGKALVRAGDRAGAETALRRAIDLGDKSPQLRIELAELLVARRAYKEAESELQLAGGAADKRFYLLLGLAQQEQGRTAEAIASYSRVIELDARDQYALYRRGRLHARQKNYSSAIPDLRAAYELSGDGETGFLLAESYMNSDQKAQAIELARAILKKSTAPELRAGLIDLLARLGANESAVEELEKLSRAEPENAQYLVQLAEIYLATDPVKSAEYWQRAVNLNPKTEHLVGLGSALLKAQRFEEAVHHFNTALSRNADIYEAHAGLGLALFKLDRFPQAAEQFIWMVQAKPQNAINYYFLGICFDRLEDFAQALKAYEFFLKLADPGINQLEIDKVHLRLPILRRQLEKQPKKKR